MSLKIALVAASLDILGGQGVQAAVLVTALAKDGYEVTFVPINPRFPTWLQRIRRYAYLRTFVNQIFYLPSLLRLRSVDVVHVFSASYWSFLLASVPAMLAGRLFRKRVLLNYHSGEAEDHMAHWGALVHPWLRLAHEIVVPSKYLREVFARFGYRCRVVPNVVDLSKFLHRERVPLRPQLLSTRNLEAYYRVEDTLRAFALIRAERPDATLTIVGYGSEEHRLRQLAASLCRDGVRFVGRIDPARIAELYDAADIFVNSSVVDNQPLSLLEAFASGLPVATTTPGDIGHLVRDGENGRTVAVRSPEAMARAVLSLIDHPEEARLFAARAREKVEDYTWQRVGERWLAAYRGEP
jgi:glycosyltransferase involved in cell wall biosynthesis